MTGHHRHDLRMSSLVDDLHAKEDEKIEYIFDFICKNRNNRIEVGCKQIYIIIIGYSVTQNGGPIEIHSVRLLADPL